MVLFTSLLLVAAMVVSGIAIFCAAIWKKINNLLPNNISFIRRKGEDNKHYMNVVINGK